MTNNRTRNTDTIIAVQRAVSLINSLADADGPVGVSTLAKKNKIPKVTTYRLLNTLHLEGLLKKNIYDEYSLDLSFIKFGEKAKSDNTIVTLAMPHMQHLADITGETVNLGIKTDFCVLNVCHIQGESSILTSTLLPLSPLYCSSMGKLFLVHMDEKDVKQYFSENLMPRTNNTKTTYEEFLEYKGIFQNEKICYDWEEYEYGLGCIAAPLYNFEGEMIAAINISGPVSRLVIKDENFLTGEIRTTADNISAVLKNVPLDNLL